MAMVLWALQQKNGMGEWTGVDIPKTVTTTRAHTMLTYSGFPHDSKVNPKYNFRVTERGRG